jgi:hypothetical protein
MKGTMDRLREKNKKQKTNESKAWSGVVQAAAENEALDAQM